MIRRAVAFLFLSAAPALAQQALLETQGSCDGNAPFYSRDFELAAGRTYRIEISGLSPNCDPVLQLRRSTDRERAHDDDPVVGEDDDGGEGLAPLLQWECDRTSFYYASVRAYDANRAGSFTLRVVEAGGGGPLFEQRGANEADRPCHTGDFDLVAGASYVVETVDLSDGCDPVLELRRSTDAQTAHPDDPVVARDDDGGGARAARLAWTCDRTGRYYATVRAFSAATAGSFTVRVTESGGGPGAALLEASGQVASDRNYYSADFELTAGRSYVVETGGLSDGCDPVVELRRSTDPRQSHPDDPVIAGDDDGGDGLNSRLVWTCDQSGPFYVAVRTYSATSGGSFHLTVREGGP